MTRTVTLTLATVDTPLPVSGSFFGYRFTLAKTSALSTPAVIDTIETVAAFTGAIAGDYMATAQALDAAKAPFGAVVSVPVAVTDKLPIAPPPMPATYKAPSALSYALS